jgi:hypothetical protein
MYEMPEPAEVMNKLPASLEFLSIMIDSFDSFDYSRANFPINLKHLEIHDNYGDGKYNGSLDFLPIGLETLILNFHCNYNVIANTSFPPKLKTLVLRIEKLNSVLRNLPTTLEYLYIHTADEGSQEGIKEYIPNVKIQYIKL